MDRSVEEQFLSFVSAQNLVPRGAHVLLAVSGGLDSMAMLHLFASCRPNGCSLSVVHVNHQLRGAESDGDELFVRETAEALDLPFVSCRVDVEDHKKRTGLSTQEAARELRYASFEQIRLSVQADLVATAHQADDNAETVLMNALRGAGIRGLSGIPVRRPQGAVIRPLLFCPRNDLRRYVGEGNIRYREDSSNASLKYRRNYFRLELMPALGRAMDSDVIASLNRISSVMRTLADRLETEVSSQFNTIVSGGHDHYTISLPSLRDQPVYLQEEILLHLFRLLGIEPSARKVQASMALMDLPTGKSVHLHKNWTLYRDRDRLLLMNPVSAPFRYDLLIGEEYFFPGFRFSTEPVSEPAPSRGHGKGVEYVDAARLNGPLVLRTWEEGDSFVPLGMSGTKKLSDFFTDEKIPLPQKHSTPLFEAGGKIVWVCGLRLDDRFRVTDQTHAVVRLNYSAGTNNIP